MRLTQMNGRTLIRLNAVILSLGMFAQIFCLPGLRRVVRSGTGALATLGLPTAHIHVSAKKSLDRAAFVLGAAGSIFMLVGIGELAMAITLVGQESLFDTVWYVVFGIYTAFGGSVTCMGLFTTYLGAELANQSIREVTLVIERTPPSSPEWAMKVNTMVMTLARETLPSVSNAWGGMVACFIFSYALIAFANFVEWLYLHGDIFECLRNLFDHVHLTTCVVAIRCHVEQLRPPHGRSKRCPAEALRGCYGSSSDYGC
jgi:hypothetical protein